MVLMPGPTGKKGFVFPGRTKPAQHCKALESHGSLAAQVELEAATCLLSYQESHTT